MSSYPVTNTGIVDYPPTTPNLKRTRIPAENTATQQVATGILADSFTSRKVAKKHNDRDFVKDISAPTTSLFCDEKIDFKEAENIHAVSDQAPPLLTSLSTPSFTDRLIVNYLSQISLIHEKDWKWLQEQKNPDFLQPTVQIVLKALNSSEPPQIRHHAFIEGLILGTKLCGNEEKYRVIKHLFGKAISSMYTRINALQVHRQALTHFTPQGALPKPNIMHYLLSGIPVDSRPPIVSELARLWAVSLQTSGNINKYLMPNLPNQLFQVNASAKKNPITFFRMQSPESPINELDPLYLRFLEQHVSQSTSHLSLTMLSPHTFDTEREIAKKRFQLQWDFVDTLNVIRCEPDSDFLSQEGDFSRKEPLNKFMKALRDQLIKESLSFEIIQEIRESSYFKNQVTKAIHFVRNLFFPYHKALKVTEKQDFALMCVVLLLENFCKDMDPNTVDTACRSHIDRGMMISTIFYIYLMIKSGKENDPQFLEYLKPLTLAPALIVAQRPPHMDKMKRVLSLASRLLQPEAVKKIKENQTFFSGCGLTIPKE